MNIDISLLYSLILNKQQLSTNCCTECIKWQLLQIFLAYIGNFLWCDVIYDLIKAGAHVQNCMASDWSVYIYLVGHMITVCFDWLWLVKKGHMTKTNCHGSFQLNCLHQVVFYVKKCDYSCWKLFEKLFQGSKCPITIENGSARGDNYP